MRVDEAPVVGSLDLGSNSFHLAVFAVQPDRSLVPVCEEREVLSLGEVVAKFHEIGPQVCQRVRSTFSRMVATARSHGADVIVAAATSAFRDALDGREVLNELERDTGVHVRIISGHEEAELIFEAVRAACQLGPLPVVGADLGGGSLEVTCGDQTQLYLGRSLPLGVGRLKIRLQDLGEADPASLSDYIASSLEEVVSAVRGYWPTRLILTSGTFTAIGRLAISLSRDRDPLEDDSLSRKVSRDALREAIVLIGATPEESLTDLSGIDARRAETVKFGAIVLDELLRGLGLEEIWLCRWGLREGAALSWVRQAGLAGDPSGLSPRAETVSHLVKKYRIDEHHADRVTALSLELFDSLASRHELDQTERELLGYGATLHALGKFISIEGYERHGRYVLGAISPKGFTKREVLILQAVVGNHRRGEVVLEEALQDRRDDSRVAQWLTALLRVADGLDATCRQVVERARFEEPGLILAKCVGEISVEEALFSKKAKLLASLVGEPLTLQWDAGELF